MIDMLHLATKVLSWYNSRFQDNNEDEIPDLPIVNV